MDSSVLRRKKAAILFLGIILFFFTSMSKVLVPGVLFNDLQIGLGMTAGQLALIGSAFMYAYAFSQLAMGIFSDRYGGVRLLLIGGSFFCAGTLAVPFLSGVWTMCAARILTALGAGTVFLGVAKLISDLFPKHFSIMLGIALLIGYLGPSTGVFPMVWLIQKMTWRPAMFLPGAISTAALIGIVCLARGAVIPVTPGNAFGAFFQLLKSLRNWLLFFSSSIVFGSYYALLTICGQKALQDIGGFSAFSASLWMTVCTLIVAGNNIVANMVLKLIGGRRRVLMLGGSVCSLAGTALGLAAFQYHWAGKWVVLAYLLIAVPAGFFSIYGTIIKELNPPEHVGLAISMLNCAAFVMIALVGQISGWILNLHETEAVRTASALLYPSSAYRDVFLFFTAVAAAGLLCSFKIPETRTQSK